MAIQFLCPHCSATITVPNSSHGKRGTCPACRKKLRVPRPVGDPPVPQSAAVTTLAEPAAPSLPKVGQPSPVPTAAVPAGGVASEAPLFAPASPAADAAVTPSALVTEAPKSVAASMSRKRRKRSSNAAFTIGIPVVCFVLFVSVMAAIFWNVQPELKGTISGAILRSFDLPGSQLSVGNLQLQADEADSVVADFSQNPERFISAMMKCSVAAKGRQLTIDVAPAEGYEWFTVSPRVDVNLLDWVKKNSEAWDAKRKVRMQAVATELCQDKLKRLAGERVVINAAKYRDEFALATQVKGFGYVVEAIAGSQRAVCAHEDANGTLYFALPENTESFVLQGRSFDKQPPAFPGSYTVKISEPETEDPETPIMTKPDAMDGSKASGSNDDSMDGQGMDDDTDDGFEDLDPPPSGMSTSGSLI